MDAKSQRRRDITLSSLNMAIEAMNLAKEVSSITPAKAVFGSVSVILAMIKDSMTNKTDYVDLGLACTDVCNALDRGLKGRRADELGQSIMEAIEQLTTTVTEIQKRVTEKGRQKLFPRLALAKNDKETIASWRLDLNRILHAFNTELAINTHVVVSDTHAMVSDTHTMVSDTHAMVSNLHRNALAVQGGTDGQHRSVSDPKYHVAHSLTPTSRILLGESPPPPPACFGRDELIEKVVGLAENLTPIALIGVGGIGKTSIALTLLHHGRIEKRFGENRRFIRCDKFPPTLPHFLHRLSNVIGAGINNPEDLTPLRSFLSSKEILIILDNAESILDPQGTNAQEIHPVVEELSQFRTISLCITSCITTVPQHCKRPIIPTLSAEAACSIFYDIYGGDDQSNIISNLLEQLDFHALSITLLATTASQNLWDHDRLAKEWDMQRTQVLQTDHNESLAATIELSLTSPMFCQLGPDAHGLLGVIAFFPQGVDMNNLNWLFPTILNRQKMFDKFCALSLTYRSSTFITMLAPLRDYLCPKDPKSSPLLCTAKNHYFSRLSADADPGKPVFEEAKWVMSEDVNVEHLLDVFMSIDADSEDVWDACASFVEHLCRHKPWLVMLGPKLEGLPDKQPSKPRCLFQLAILFQSVGNFVEAKRLLIHTLELWRGRGNDFWVAETLMSLASTNRMLGCYTEGMQQVEESLGIYKQLNDTLGQIDSFYLFARLLLEENQPDAAEEAVSQSINLLLDKGEQPRVCQHYDLLGDICHSKGETEKAINYHKIALGIASSLNWCRQQFQALYSLAVLFFDQGRFDEAHAHIELAKLHTVNNPYLLGHGMERQAWFWYIEGRPEEAKSEALCAVGVYEKVGAAKDVEGCRKLLQKIEGK